MATRLLATALGTPSSYSPDRRRTRVSTPSNQWLSCYDRKTFKDRVKNGTIRCEVVDEGSSTSNVSVDQTVYQGAYGSWTVEDSDVREVSFLIFLPFPYEFTLYWLELSFLILESWFLLFLSWLLRCGAVTWRFQILLDMILSS